MGRYRRQEVVIGAEGQARLGAGCALVVGCGALGCVSADLLVRAGVGRVVVVDRDVVERSNLQRQTLFADADVGWPKAEAARRRLAAVNPEVIVEGAVADLTALNAERVGGFGGSGAPGVIVDGTDNFETRYLLNDLAVKHGVAFVYAGAVATRGMVMVVRPGETACLRCVFPEAPAPGTQPTCETAGVLASATAIAGARQAAEAIKVLGGAGEAVATGLWEFDVWSNRERRVDVGSARADCVCCGLKRFEYLEGGRSGDGARLCGREAVQIGASLEGVIDLAALAGRLAGHGRFEASGLMLKGTLAEERGDGGGPMSLTVFHDGRAIVEGTTDVGRARGVYARYVGG